ncbi:MerR family transcriptional regulator [Grimontia marina]|uniref:HTH-type transcriptional repressor YcgE n=1 Tax=Grimontia marina TaxID=646534 RepID=A0A128FBN1_9GAMM|nr:MerR family transcriptional regulator [Grimontia marina]CZF84217.1 HTH-type transcriptional repressor YcgE [Grimontia marina]
MDSKEKMLSIGEVSEHTGVNSVTLRAWQRRYGLITPKRTPKGHRLYSEQDVKHIREILSWLDKGVPVSQVKELLGTNPSQFAKTENLPEFDTLKALVMSLDLKGLETRLYELTKTYPIHVLEAKLFQPLTDWFDAQSSEAGVLFTQIWRAELTNVLVHCLLMSKKVKGKDRCWIVSISRDQSYHFYLKALLLQSEGYVVTTLDGIGSGLSILCSSLVEKGVKRFVIHSDQAFTPVMRREIAELVVLPSIDIEVSGECKKIYPELAMASAVDCNKTPSNV